MSTTQPAQQPASEALTVLRLFVGAAYPVCTSIDPRGHRWCEPYLDSALQHARKALSAGKQSAPTAAQHVNAAAHVDSSTIYALNANGTNRWWATVHPGRDDDGKSIDMEECRAVAQALASRAADHIADASKMIDIEEMIKACLPGGQWCDPQRAADDIRQWFAERPQSAIDEAFERGRQQGMQQERALWELAKTSQELGGYK